MPSKLVPMKREHAPTNGEPLLSLMLGAPSLSIALVLLASLFGSPVLGLTKPGTVVIDYKIIGHEEVVEDGFVHKVPIKGGQPTSTAPAWWYAPNGFHYFIFAMVGTLLPIPGIVLSGKRQGRVAFTALIGNLTLFAAGYVLVFIDGNG